MATKKKSTRKKVSTRKSEVGSRKSEVGRRKSGDGSRKSEVGSGKLEDERKEMDVVEELDSAQMEKKPLIHILVRTHQRPGYFKKCLESIAAQTYEWKIVHVIADDDVSEKYANEALDAGLCDEVLRVDKKAETLNVYGDFKALQRAGFCKNNSDFRKHPYDLYLNWAMDTIDNGYIFIVDDDKQLPKKNLLSEIAANLLEEVVVIGQYAMKSRTLPTGDYWEKLPFTRAHIDMSCVVFHAKHKTFARLDGHGAGDWRLCNKLAEKLSPVWIKKPFTVADNDGNFGRSEGRIKR